MAGIINNQQSLIFSFNHGKLIVKDICEEYTNLDFTKYVCLDYIIKNGSITNMIIRENINTPSDILLNEFILLKDGIYEYYRILVPRAKKYIDKINEGSVFYYQQKIYKALETSSNIDLSKCEEVKYVDLYNVLDNSTESDTIYSKYIIFSFEKLKQAFVDSQKDYIDSNKFGAKTNIVIREKRDMLLSAILLIREYVNNDMFKEASNIIEVLESNTCLNIYNNEKDLCYCKNVKQDKFELQILYAIDGDDLLKSTTWVFGDSFPIIFS